MKTVRCDSSGVAYTLLKFWAVGQFQVVLRMHVFSFNRVGHGRAVDMHKAYAPTIVDWVFFSIRLFDSGLKVYFFCASISILLMYL